MERLQDNFYKGKKILVTGHTGFKGAWLCKLLLDAGADVTGYALQAPTTPSLFALSGIETDMRSVEGDVRDLEHLEHIFRETGPEIVIHMAAQPIVREGVRNPVYTYETNVMGTVNVCECVRIHDSVRSFVNVTTDKVYDNKEWLWGYRENDALDGRDPYSNSKSCSELVTHSYARTYFEQSRTAVSAVRAGNVIGGGDFAPDRILPDCVRAAQNGETILIRNPASVRPYQHVLEAICAYLMVAGRQYDDVQYAGAYNVGPDSKDCITAAELADMFCRMWGDGMRWESYSDGGPREAGLLRLDCSLLKNTFGWEPRWTICEAVGKTVEWSKEWLAGKSVRDCMEDQIHEFLETHNRPDKLMGGNL